MSNLKVKFCDVSEISSAGDRDWEQSRAVEPFSASFIMLIRNETDFTEQSLNAVLSQDYPHKHLGVLGAGVARQYRQ